MICLGIESTAHTFGVGIISEKKEILADFRDMHTTEKGGIIPNETANHHRKFGPELIRSAIEESKNKKIDMVAFSRGPGIGPCLYVGFNLAKEVAKELRVPLIGVNHPLAHLSTSTLFTEAKDPVYVFVSGANTQIIAYESGKFRVFGETLDTALGNCLDKFGRVIDLGFPAGPKIEELAKKGKYMELPYTVKGMDVSFSGILTKAQELFRKGISKEDLCYSLQETCFSMVTEVTERALAHTQKKEVVLIGGVAANKRFCEMLDIMCKERGARFYSIPLKYAGDNGVMIAWQGLLEYGKSKEKIEVRPYERVDQVKISWINS